VEGSKNVAKSDLPDFNLGVDDQFSWVCCTIL